MTPNEYQARAMLFAKYKYPDYPALALTEEVGEVMGKLAKYSRKNDSTLTAAIYQAISPIAEAPMQLRADLEKELGDVLWQFSALCYELNFNLDDIMEANLAKLTGREERGTIVGSGDNR